MSSLSTSLGRNTTSHKQLDVGIDEEKKLNSTLLRKCGINGYCRVYRMSVPCL